MEGTRTSGNSPKARFLSKDECLELANKVIARAEGGGDVHIGLDSVWSGNIRWARNTIATSGDIRKNSVTITRANNFASGKSTTNELSDWHVTSTLRRAERLMQLEKEGPGSELFSPYIEPYREPRIWFDRSYTLTAEERADIVRKLVKPAEDAGMLAAGYIEVSAQGRASIAQGATPLYYPFTMAQYSVTVRDPEGKGSGWAGMDHNDWGQINTEELSAIALDKCLRSRNPVAIEPGRYTTVLEPQAVNDLVAPLFVTGALSRVRSEDRNGGVPFWLRAGHSKIGLQVIDSRISISVDPMDPDIGFPPFTTDGIVYNPVTWIEHGVLKELAYDRKYAIRQLGLNSSLQNPNAYKMSGGSTSIDSMIASTKRGLLVTRFSDVTVLDSMSLICTGTTRDGLWLIENGKISKPVKNFRITESPLVMLNNVLDLGVPKRVLREIAPACVPALKIRDFSFTSMSDAV